MLCPIAVLLALSGATSPQTPAALQRGTESIDSLMITLHRRGQFDGEVLVARRDTVIYRRAFGDARPGVPFTDSTATCLGSVSKQFTAMAIMTLAEQGKLRYDDLVSRFIPEFAQYAPGITIRHLLTHTSGIPDYGNLDVDRPGLTNADVWRAVRTHPPRFAAGQRYEYSNTGYVLLAMIVERVTAQPFATFLKERIFAPLGMRHSFVLTDPAQKNAYGAATAFDEFGNRDDYDELVAGDNGMYSSVDDLRRWDVALRHDRLVSRATLTEAFTPARVADGTDTYGFGWNVTAGDDGVRVWHTGNTAGFRAYIERGLQSGITVILLTNNGNTNRIAISEDIHHILNGQPYSLPKLSVARRMHDLVRRSNVDDAVRFYRTLKASRDTTYDRSEGELNALGYQLLDADKAPAAAISIFSLNAAEHPASSNAYDSLAEAYVRTGNRAQGIVNYEKALALDRGNAHAAEMLEKLRTTTPPARAPLRSASSPEGPLTADVRRAVVDSISRALQRNYVWPDTAARMADHLSQRLRAGAYDDISDPGAFAAALTRDLRTVYRDVHLSIAYASAPMLGDTRNRARVERRTTIDARTLARRANFGIGKAEVLPDDVGYLPILHLFDSSPESRAALSTAFRTLRHSRALIIDLRDDRGGSPDMVRLICGYLFPARTHLNDLFERRTGTTTHYWSEPATDATTLFTVPVFVLVSHETFSAAEELAYDLQSQRRAVIVGETTGGGAHAVWGIPVGYGFVANVPWARAINPVTGTNWEGVGVQPDIRVGADSALEATVRTYQRQQRVRG